MSLPWKEHFVILLKYIRPTFPTYFHHTGFLSVSQLQSALEKVLEQSVTFEQSQSVMNNFSKQKPGKTNWKKPKQCLYCLNPQPYFHALYRFDRYIQVYYHDGK